jgi:EAL domain-containing protein (putative c-di-GMP-specific phosphodiesterase class I)/CheY-like chemotaxis protein
MSFSTVHSVNSAGAIESRFIAPDVAVPLVTAIQSAIGLQYFTDAMETKVRTLVMLGTEFREAITSGQLFLVYQPQIDVDTREISGVRALVRWRHATRGSLLPSQFMPAAEMCGLIVALEDWVLHEAFRQMKEWHDAGIAPPLIAVNLSGPQFKKPLELEHDITTSLSETALPNELIELQLTERVFTEASHEHNGVLQKLRKTGLQIAFQDFGNGFSSLEYLGRFPVDRVRIRQSFLQDLVSGSGNASIIKTAIGLAQDLGLHVIVEGVESAEQLELVRSWSGRKVHGYCFSRPLPAGEMDAVLRGRIALFPRERQRRHMNPFRVLHIDDDSNILDIVAASLGVDPEFVVRECGSGADGLAVATEWRPDLILLDVMMPVMDGPSTLRQLREIPQTADIPVVFVTARAQTSEIEHFKSLGTAGVIAKPFNPKTLAASVRNYMEAANLA